MLFSPEAWQQAFVMRAHTLTVAKPLDADWKEFSQALREQFKLVTTLKNWIVDQLYAADVRREPGSPVKAKMPPMKAISFYQAMKEDSRWDDVIPATRVVLEHAVQGVWRKKRYDVLWTSTDRQPRYTYPQPLPFRPDSFKLSLEGQPKIEVRFANRWWALAVRAGAEFGRQIYAVKQMIAGDAIPVECSLMDRSNEIRVKLVAWMQRKEVVEKQADKFLSIRTEKDNRYTACCKIVRSRTSSPATGSRMPSSARSATCNG